MQRSIELASCLIAVFNLGLGFLHQVLQFRPHRLLGFADNLIVVFLSLVLADQALIAHRNLTVEAKVLQVLRGMNATVQRLMDSDLLGGLAQIFQLHNLMVLEATHIPVSIVATSAQEIGTIVAARDGHFLALARSTSQHRWFNCRQIQYVGQDVVLMQRCNALGSHLSRLIARRTLDQSFQFLQLVVTHELVQASFAEDVQTGQNTRRNVLVLAKRAILFHALG